jgi:hypothetical protein
MGDWQLELFNHLSLGYDGVVDFQIHCEKTIRHEDVEYFMRDCLQKYTDNESLTMCDNASIHLAPTTRAVFDEVTLGRWKTIPVYSPYLAPIENLFAMVWNYIRSNEVHAMANPLEWIQRGFHEFAVGAPRGKVCRPLWNLYLRNHESFLNRVAVEGAAEFAAML